MPKIVFLCTRNRFRSPLAAAILKREIAVRELPGEWKVESAGSWVHDLLPPTPEAFYEAEKRGLDLSSHISVGIEELDLDAIDLLLVMEQGQKEAIQLGFPNSAKNLPLRRALGSALQHPRSVCYQESCDVIAQEIEH